MDLVEVNSTFYRPADPGPGPVVAEEDRALPGFPPGAQAPPVLHPRAVRASPGKDVDAFKAAADVLHLRGRLAALLVQFPWSFRNTPENADYLARLLAVFAGYPLAVEVRHASWDTPAFYDALRGAKAAFCNIDQPLFDDSIAPSAVATDPDFAYVRLHGRNRENWFREGAGRDARYDYLYAADELEDWVARIKELGPEERQGLRRHQQPLPGTGHGQRPPDPEHDHRREGRCARAAAREIPGPAGDRPGHQGRSAGPLRQGRQDMNWWETEFVAVEDNKLRIAGQDAAELAERYGTPLYIYGKDRILERYARLDDAFGR
ncbi:MAG: DUF72 domain-containing protein [Candidatus Moduliflexus flocculans]|nr:DUF72 domain-containing protein [Candidatus Moduliflexus flocculans]